MFLFEVAGDRLDAHTLIVHIECGRDLVGGCFHVEGGIIVLELATTGLAIVKLDTAVCAVLDYVF